jgi:tRNA 2-thiouridine synthesizing protein E
MADVMSDQEKQELFLGVHSDDEPLVSQWDRGVAESRARELGIKLDDQGWDVVQFLRQYYEEMGAIDYARDLSVMLEQRYKEEGGLRYLFTLFPGGPITQGCMIAGIPVPRDNADPSFGYQL